MATGKSSSKRELIDTGSDKRYVRSDENGQFHESDDQGRSLSKVLGSMPKPNPNAARGIAEIADDRTDMTADEPERFERDQPHHWEAIILRNRRAKLTRKTIPGPITTPVVAGNPD